MSQKRKIAEPNATAIARPPGRGIGRWWTRRPPGTSSMPRRRARIPTSGVAIAASAKASTVEPTRRIAVEDTIGTIPSPRIRRSNGGAFLDSPSVALRVRLLGRPGLEHDGESRRLEGHKTWALLAYLLLESRAPTRRELADLLWSEADDPLGAVRWALSQVRKSIDPPAEIGERDGRIKIDSEVIVVDAGELLRGEWDEESIDDLVRGELLEGMSFDESPAFDTWLQVQRARVAAAAADALRWAATLLAHREPDRALALAERGLRNEPFDDALHELIVEIHAGRGDRERARTYIAAITRRYRDELNADPPASISRPLERAPRSAAEPLLRLDVQARALLDIANVRLQAADFASARDIALRAARQAA